jgi:hypothetical protein
MLSGEATNTNLIVFGLTRSVLELTIYRIRGEHANHYATDAVVKDRTANLRHIKCVQPCLQTQTITFLIKV